MSGGGGKAVGNEIPTLSSKSEKEGGAFADLVLSRGQLTPLRVKLHYLLKGREASRKNLGRNPASNIRSRAG